MNNQNTWTQGEEHHTLKEHVDSGVGVGERQQRVGREGRVGRDNMRRNVRYSIHLK